MCVMMVHAYEGSYICEWWCLYMCYDGAYIRMVCMYIYSLLSSRPCEVLQGSILWI